MDIPPGLLDVIGVSKHYGGVRALDGVNFSASGGEVHALLGENGAGKSTLVKILSGAIVPDRGEIRISGQLVRIRSPHEAVAHGIRTVHQESAMVPSLSVAQNVWYGREPRTRLGTIAASRMARQTTALFRDLGVDDIDVNAEARTFSVAERQIVEVARALSTSPRVLILDEATSALDSHKVEWLLGLARKIAAEGTLVIFISHRLQEARRVADRVTIFRNGHSVAARAMTDLTDSEIVQEMLGRQPTKLFPDRAFERSAEVVLRVTNLAAGKLRGISFELRRGEILGVGGLQGQGEAELLLALCGAIPSAGEIEVFGERRTFKSPRDALKAGIVIVPEDRKREGLLLTKSIASNLSLPILSRLTRHGLLDAAAERRTAAAMAERLQVVAESLEQLTGTLSGGNQQKVVIGKALLTEARILLLFDLVRGVDVGTKAEVFKLARELTAAGYSMVFYSSDLQELVNVSDRVIVIADGRISGELGPESLSEEAVLRASVGAIEALRA